MMPFSEALPFVEPGRAVCVQECASFLFPWPLPPPSPTRFSQYHSHQPWHPTRVTPGLMSLPLKSTTFVTDQSKALSSRQREREREFTSETHYLFLDLLPKGLPVLCHLPLANSTQKDRDQSQQSGGRHSPGAAGTVFPRPPWVPGELCLSVQGPTEAVRNLHGM